MIWSFPTSKKPKHCGAMTHRDGCVRVWAQRFVVAVVAATIWQPLLVTLGATDANNNADAVFQAVDLNKNPDLRTRLSQIMPKYHVSGSKEAQPNDEVMEMGEGRTVKDLFRYRSPTRPYEAYPIVIDAARQTASTPRAWVNWGQGVLPDAAGRILYPRPWTIYVFAFGDAKTALRYSMPGPDATKSDLLVRRVGDTYVLVGISTLGPATGPAWNQLLDAHEETIKQTIGKLPEPGTRSTPASPTSMPSNDPSGGIVPGDETVMETPMGDISPEATALGTLAVSGISAIGAWLMMLGMGVTPKDLIDGAKELFGGASAPIPPPLPVTHHDGETNEFGEVWSDEDRGWVGRNLYDEEKSRRTWIADKAGADLHTGQSEDVKKDYDAWQDSKAKLGEIQEQNREAERLRRIEQKHAELEALEAESTKGVQAIDVADNFMRGVEDTTRSGIADLSSSEVWQEFGSSVKKDVGQLWDDAKEGAVKGETYLNAGKAVLHSAKGMAEGIAMVGKAGWHVVAHPIDTTQLVLNAGGDPLAAVEFVTRTADQMVGSIVDPKKRLSERLQGVAKLEMEAVMGEGLGKAAGVVGELKAVQNLLDKVDDLKTGIFGKAAEATGQRVWGTGQTMGREAEQAALAKLPPGHPARKIGEINEAAAKAGPEFNSRLVRLVKGESQLNDASATYQKGIEALKADPKYLTPDAKRVADAVRYDQHLRAQQQAVKNMLAEHPELRGHLEGIENTGSHAWRRSDYKPGRSDIDINARGDGTALGKKVEETYPEYYRKSVNEVSGKKLTPEDLKANCYGDGKAQGALKSQTGKDFVESYKATGKGRLDVFDNETGRFEHSLDGKDPLLNGDRKFFDRSNPAEAAGKAQEIHADVAAKHFEETASLPMNEKLRQGAKNVKTIGNIARKFTGQPLPEPIAKLVKNAAALEKLSPTAQQQALDLLEGFLKLH